MKDTIMMTIAFVDIKLGGLPDEPGTYLVAWDDGSVESYPIDAEEIEVGEVSTQESVHVGGKRRYTKAVYATHWAEVEHPNIALAERAKTLAATDKLKGAQLT